jgi:HEAT repeat protein
MLRWTLTLCLATCLVPPALAQPRRVKPGVEIGELLHKLRANLDGQRIVSAQALSDYADQLQRAVLALSGRLRADPVAAVRAECAQALAHIGPSAHEAVPALIAALGDEDEAVRRMAALALGKMGRYAGAAVPALITAFKDKNKAVRRRAVIALGGIGPDARAAVPTLIALLDDTDLAHGPDDAPIRELAIAVLGLIGPDAKPAVPALLKLERSGNAYVRGLCLMALPKIGAGRETVVPLLVKALKDPGTRANAAYTLARLDPPVKEAVPALLEALRAKDISYDVEARRAKLGVILALGNVGPDARTALPVLRELTSAPDSIVRSFAQRALAQVEGASKRGRP